MRFEPPNNAEVFRCYMIIFIPRRNSSNTSKKRHKDVRYRQCGIFIDKTKQYLGTSPDLLIECSCCGEAVVEIKNPFSIANEIPSVHNLSYLCTCNGQVTLSSSISILHRSRVKWP